MRLRKYDLFNENQEPGLRTLHTFLRRKGNPRSPGAAAVVSHYEEDGAKGEQTLKNREVINRIICGLMRITTRIRAMKQRLIGTSAVCKFRGV